MDHCALKVWHEIEFSFLPYNLYVALHKGSMLYHRIQATESCEVASNGIEKVWHKIDCSPFLPDNLYVIEQT